ncbi:ribosome biogenesis protein Mak21p [Diutina catenulata]
MSMKLDLSSLKDKVKSKLEASEKKGEAKKARSASDKDKKSKDDRKEKDEDKKSKKNDKKEDKKTEHKKDAKKDAKKDSKKDNKKDKKEKKEVKFEEPKEEEEAASSALREEAMALGATEEDLKLIEGLADSDSEQEFESKGDDKSLQADLAKFYQGIGFSGNAEVVDDDEASEAEDASDDEPAPKKDGSGSKAEESEVSKKAADKAAQKEAKRAEKKAQKAEAKAKRAEEKAAKEKEKEEAKSENEKALEAKRQQKNDYVDNLNSVESSRFKLANRTDWYNIEAEAPTDVEPVHRFAREELEAKAKAVIDRENEIYMEEFTRRNSQKKFLQQILQDGTLNDKISALTLLIQEAPLHNIKALDTLVGYCEKKSRTASLQAIAALKDLLVNGVLPDRRLVAFTKRPLSRSTPETTLALWWFEDHLKKQYFKLVSVLEHLLHDPILHVRMTCVGHVFDLLKAKPEQEQNLLRLGVNKLGDGDSKVAAKTSFQILQLENDHPAMKQIVTDAITDIIFKPGTEYSARYYAVTTLNQTILSSKFENLANTLVKTYFALFESALAGDKRGDDKLDAIGNVEHGRKNNRKGFKRGKKGGKSVKQTEKTESEVVEERNAKLFSALLTGLNRAFPYASLDQEIYDKHLDTLYKITHSSNFNTSVQALSLVHNIVSRQKLNSDRYFRTLYESLLDPRVATTSKQGIYLNLLYKSLKENPEVPRVLAFVKRILQISAHWLNVGAVAGMLYLLQQLALSFPQVHDLMLDVANRPDDLLELAGTEPYDAKKRDPKFAHAANSSVWEMAAFVHHFHPTVAIYAQSLVEMQQQPKPDLGLYTLSHFLDRFVYKNAKQGATTKGSSIMQPLGGAQTGTLLVRATGMAQDSVPVNALDWLNKRADQVRPDEQFFHQYFTTKQEKIRGEKKKTKDEEEEEDGEAGSDNEVWEALVKSQPDVEMDDDGFESEEMDFGSDDFSSDDEVPAEGAAEEEPDFAQFDGSDAEDLVLEDAPSDDESGEEEFFSALMDDSADEEELEVPKKRASEGDDKKKKRMKISSLPTFAAPEDYQQYLDSD